MPLLSLVQELQPLVGAGISWGSVVAMGGNYAALSVTIPNAAPGKIAVYVRAGSTWSLLQTLQAPIPTNGDTYGSAIALSPDGTMLFVTAPSQTATRGTVYFYLLTAGLFVLTQTLQGTDGAVTDQYGLGVSISGTGDLVIPARQSPTGAVGQPGNVYYYTLVAGVWTLQQKFNAADTTSQFGAGNGNTGIYTAGGWLMVSGRNAGGFSWYFFKLIAGAWVQQQELTAPAGEIWANSGAFMTPTGLTAVIGSRQSGAPFNELARIYVLTGGVWTLQQILTHVDDGLGDLEGFAQPYTISGTDANLVIGAPKAVYAGGVAGNGQVYVYAFSGATWALSQTLLPPADFPVNAGGNGFGTATASLPGLTWVLVGVTVTAAPLSAVALFHTTASVNIVLGLKGMKVYPQS